MKKPVTNSGDGHYVTGEKLEAADYSSLCAEVMNTITSTGVELDGADDTQLLKAVDSRAAAMAAKRLRMKTANLGGTISQTTTRGPGFCSGTVARTVNGRKRAFWLSLRTCGTSLNLFSASLDYTDLASMTAANVTFGTVDTTGFTLDVCTTTNLAQAYLVQGSDGALYVVAFLTEYSGSGQGTVLVFKEVSPGSLKLLSQTKDTINDAMRSVIATKSDNKEWMVLTSKGFDVWRWNQSALKAERQSSTAGLLPAAVGRDSLGRTWVIERPASATGLDTYKVHVFPPEGLVAYVETKFEQVTAGVDYPGHAVATNLLVDARDRDGLYVAANVTVNLMGPATFSDGSVTKTIATTTSGPLSVPCLITGPGVVNANGGI